MTTYKVTVETLMPDGKVLYIAEYRIKAETAEEAEGIVHNEYVLQREPRFRIKGVEEVEAECL